MRYCYQSDQHQQSNTLLTQQSHSTFMFYSSLLWKVFTVSPSNVGRVDISQTRDHSVQPFPASQPVMSCGEEVDPWWPTNVDSSDHFLAWSLACPAPGYSQYPGQELSSEVSQHSSDIIIGPRQSGRDMRAMVKPRWEMCCEWKL